MSYKHFGLAAGFAVAANAFMIPSTMSAPEIKDDGINALKSFNPMKMANDDAAKESGHVVKLECPGCEVAGAQGVPMSLILNWTITDNNRGLNLNDVPFFGHEILEGDHQYMAPQMPSSVPDSFTSIFTRAETVSFLPDDSETPVAITPQGIDFDYNTRRISATDDTDDQLIDVDLSITSVTSGNAKGIDALTLRLLQNSKGELTLLEIVRVPADGSAAEEMESHKQKQQEDEEATFEILPIGQGSAPNGAPATDDKHKIVDCHGLPLAICKLQYAVRTKIANIHNALSGMGGEKRPCPGRMGQHGPPGLKIKGGVPKFTTPDGRPKFHPHHAHHGGMHKALRFMRRFFFGFVVPVMIGVAAGMTASVAGMVVGTGLAMLWFRFKRGGKRGSTAAVEEGARDECEGLMSKDEEYMAEPRDSEETLPAYEEKASQ